MLFSTAYLTPFFAHKILVFFNVFPKSSKFSFLTMNWAFNYWKSISCLARRLNTSTFTKFVYSRTSGIGLDTSNHSQRSQIYHIFAQQVLTSEHVAFSHFVLSNNIKTAWTAKISNAVSFANWFLLVWKKENVLQKLPGLRFKK